MSLPDLTWSLGSVSRSGSSSRSSSDAGSGSSSASHSVQLEKQSWFDFFSITFLDCTRLWNVWPAAKRECRLILLRIANWPNRFD